MNAEQSNLDTGGRSPYDRASAFKIVAIGTARGEDRDLKAAREIAAFCGLEMLSYVYDPAGDPSCIYRAIRRAETLAVVITAEALSMMDRDELHAVVRINRLSRLPVLVVGISGKTESESLRRWSGETVLGLSSPVEKSNRCRVETVEGLTRQISGQTLKLGNASTGLVVDRTKAKVVLTVCAQSEQIPVFVQTTVGNLELFFCSLPLTNDKSTSIEQQFSNAAPLHLFIAYAAGDRGWHRRRTYANLTIDDPLLRRNYGHVHYAELLRQMQRHNFHTTIAYIPWNFERTDPSTVALFKANPDRFSITVHGNNHDHREFPSVAEKPLVKQRRDVAQALVRMDRFSALTGLPYDKVMVFPHSIASEPALQLLKEHNYLATVNSQNVPLGAESPADPNFSLRPVTLAFANFPALRRCSAELPVSSAELAIHAFLGNPLLLYVHQQFFSAGLDRFNELADTIQRIDPGVLWCGLGEIARRLYWEKIRDDGDVDVLAYTGELNLENSDSREAAFWVRKDETDWEGMQVSVDGAVQPFVLDGSSILIRTTIPPNKAKRLQITYRFEPPKETGANGISARIAALRYASEFRDNTLSKYIIGRRIIRIYQSTTKRSVSTSYRSFKS